MEKISNIKQATEYVYKQLKEINPTIEEEDVYDTILDEILESAEYIMTDEDMKFLEENEKNLQAIDEYFSRKIPDYSNLLDDIVTDMVSDEILLED